VEIRVGVTLAESEEAGEQFSWVALLAEDLSEVDGLRVESTADEGPAGAKGLGSGALIVRLSDSVIGRLVDLVRGFAVRTGRTVKASIDGDSIEITGASLEQQDKVIEAWLARHPARS
jgi:hypothetical protein